MRDSKLMNRSSLRLSCGIILKVLPARLSARDEREELTFEMRWKNEGDEDEIGHRSEVT
jgi:hypothetical protein